MFYICFHKRETLLQKLTAYSEKIYLNKENLILLRLLPASILQQKVEMLTLLLQISSDDLQIFSGPVLWQIKEKQIL